MDERNKQTFRTLTLSISTGLFLAVTKFVIGLVTHSMAVMSSALDSMLDVTVSTVNLIAAREAAKPPDEEHSYGHGKVESLAGLFQSILIGLSGLYIVGESVKRLIVGSFVHSPFLGIGVMIFSMVASWLLIWRLKSMAKRYQSMILETESLHFTMDILSNGGVIAALVLVRWTGLVIWDLVISILVAGYILKTSYAVFRRAIDELLDRSIAPVSKDEIEKLVLDHHPTIVGIHNFRSHCVGNQIFLDFHIEIRGEHDFKRAHGVTEHLIADIRKKYPGSDIVVHYDPEGEI